MTIRNLPFFVYGTLLPGHINYRRFFQKLKPIREVGGTLDNHVLIADKQSAFPYMACAQDLPQWTVGWPEIIAGVRGVLLCFSDEDFPKIVEALDYLEGVPDHYNRKIVTIDGVEAWTYYAEEWLVKELLPYPFVASGDWDARESKRPAKK